MVIKTHGVLGQYDFTHPCKVLASDSDFLDIIDPDAYRGFVHADWTRESIQEHFRQEMRERHLLV